MGVTQNISRDLMSWAKPHIAVLEQFLRRLYTDATLASALSAPISANLTSNNISILSNEISILSQQVSVLSNQVSILSQQVSVLSQSVSVLSNQISVLSQQVSVHSQQISVLSQTLSTQINQLSILSQSVSVLSQSVSVLSNAVSVLSQSVSVLSQSVSVISQGLSVLSQQMSVLSAGLGALQRNTVTNAQAVSSTALLNISGLSVSVISAGVYQIDAEVIWEGSVVLDTIGFGLTYPGMFRCVGYMKTNTQIGQAAGTEIVGYFNEGSSGSIVLSTTPLSGSPLMMRMEGLVNVSAVNGTIQLQTRVSVATNLIVIRPGSYIRAYRLA